jgi:hypothetical protein
MVTKTPGMVAIIFSYCFRDNKTCEVFNLMVFNLMVFNLMVFETPQV